MSDEISAAERRMLADKVGCNERFLYQCLTGRNAMQPLDAVRAERVTAGRIRRWQLRRSDWHLIWPELVGTEGAPQIPDTAAATECASHADDPTTPAAPDTEQLVLACIHVLCHGPYASAHQRARVLHPCTEPVGHSGVMLQAEVVLAATARAVFAELHPAALARISQAVALARAKWPPQFRALDGGSHWRPE